MVRGRYPQVVEAALDIGGLQRNSLRCGVGVLIRCGIARMDVPPSASKGGRVFLQFERGITYERYSASSPAVGDCCAFWRTHWIFHVQADPRSQGSNRQICLGQLPHASGPSICRRIRRTDLHRLHRLGRGNCIDDLGATTAIDSQMTRHGQSAFACNLPCRCAQLFKRIFRAPAGIFTGQSVTALSIRGAHANCVAIGFTSLQRVKAYGWLLSIHSRQPPMDG